MSTFHPYVPEDIYRIAIEEAPILAALYVGPEIRIAIANKLMLEAWGKDETIIGKPLRDAVPELQGQPFFEYCDNAFRTGIEHVSTEEKAMFPVNGTYREYYYTFNYKPLKDEEGRVWGIMHTALDVTQQVLSKKATEEVESNFRNMILQSPVATCIYSGPQFVLSAANDAMLELMGKTADQVMNKPFAEGLPEVKDEGFDQLLESVYTTGSTFQAQEQPASLPRNGKVERVYVNFTYTPVRNDKGDITGVMGIAYDVSVQVNSRVKLETALEEKNQIEKNLREERERLNKILETMAEGIGIVDIAGNLTYANPMAQKILGLHQDEILQRKYSDPEWKNLRLDGSPLPEEEHPMYITMKTGKPVFDYEIAVEPPTGERIYISINAAPIKNEFDEIVAGIGSFMDVTQRRKLIRQKDEFISVASHELKTPLTSVNAGFQLLERYFKTSTEIPDRISQIARSTNTNLRKISALVDDLLNITKIEKGKLTLNKTTFNAAELINECCDHITLTGSHQIETVGDLSLKLYGDKQKIEQVIVNLINNAIKYSPKINKIIIEAQAVEDKTKISVRDFGIGIEKEKVSKIFEQFYRVEDSTHQFSGLGLGLYISSEIIKQHGGEIGVESEPEEGSVFWFTLPNKDSLSLI